ncbi:hypothetical protein M501DRAFT_936475 [Patellaria atrata CBS 101060]|uniref:Kinetochore protein Mis13 n=1 Tax=Patellaria atrata CBS 101060 TaxID=1346257 RepID=A0A9P4SA54_9PEZI|nr:hypothetical protein M501DRAFT_936475 [Patellaria atrata CBS 101060]
MTATFARSPLQVLNMASTQRPTRRRSARHAFDEEEVTIVPVKRSRMEKENNVGAKVNGKANGATGRKAKAGEAEKLTVAIAYDEDDDGFQFSRTRKKKATKAVPAQETIPEEFVPAPAPAPTTRRKKNSLTVPVPVESEALPKKRRSARLSQENQQVQVTSQPEPEKPARTARKTAKSKLPPDQEDGVAFVESNELKVQKKRGEGAKIPLPFADTPVQKRNKAMRQGAAVDSGHRRSSTGMRGRRASSLIESGSSNAVPHAEVETQDFYKHIEQSLPEPRRMRQLLTWCGSRALPPKPSGGSEDTSAIMAARAIQKELLEDFANKSDLSNWFNREDSASSSIPKKPNPVNVKHAQMLQNLEQEVKRLQDEKEAWQRILGDSQSIPPLPSEPPSTSNTTPHIDPSLLDPSQAAILTSLSNLHVYPPLSPDPSTDRPSQPAPSISKTALETRLTTLTTTLEPTLDIFADGVHHLTQYRVAAERVATRVLASAAEKLERRDRAGRKVAGSEDVGVGDVLVGLGRVLGER